jgi:hypothetical protein
MNAGLTKDDIIKISNELANSNWKDEASLCAVTAIGQALRYEEKHKKMKPSLLPKEKKIEIENKLKQCFKKCGIARRQLRICITNSLKAGLTKEEVLAITDDLVGGFGKEQVSVCAIIAIDEVLKSNEINKLKKAIKIYAPYMKFEE